VGVGASPVCPPVDGTSAVRSKTVPRHDRIRARDKNRQEQYVPVTPLAEPLAVSVRAGSLCALGDDLTDCDAI
jgi:hypothetical protein